MLGQVIQEEKASSTVAEDNRVRDRDVTRRHAFNVNNCSVQVCAIFWRTTLL